MKNYIPFTYCIFAPVFEGSIIMILFSFILLILVLIANNLTPRWLSGRTFASHAQDRGSISDHDKPYSLIQVVTAPQLNVRQLMWVSGVLVSHRRCDTLKNPYCSMAMSDDIGRNVKPAKVTSPHECKILEWDEQTNIANNFDLSNESLILLHEIHNLTCRIQKRNKCLSCKFWCRQYMYIVLIYTVFSDNMNNTKLTETKLWWYRKKDDKNDESIIWNSCRLQFDMLIISVLI